LGAAFGVHRALDTAGAMIGPLIAFGLLTVAPGAYDAVFVVSLCAAIIGLGVLILFVQNPPTSAAEPVARPALSPAAAARLVRVPGLGPLLLVGTALSLDGVGHHRHKSGTALRLDFVRRPVDVARGRGRGRALHGGAGRGDGPDGRRASSDKGGQRWRTHHGLTRAAWLSRRS
jgi:hypothetical protein